MVVNDRECIINGYFLDGCNRVDVGNPFRPGESMRLPGREMNWHSRSA